MCVCVCACARVSVCVCVCVRVCVLEVGRPEEYHDLSFPGLHFWWTAMLIIDLGMTWGERKLWGRVRKCSMECDI